MNNELNPVIASSTDSTRVSNTVKGILLAFSAVIIGFLASLFNIHITPQDYIQLATDVSVMVGAIWSVFGLLHKGVVTFGRVR